MSVYVLECSPREEEGASFPTFYVGYTENLTKRIAQHFLGAGSAWTKKFKPLRVLSVQEGGKKLETAVTVQMMITHGWKNVRGSGWSSVVMEIPPSFARGNDDTEEEPTHPRET